MFNEMTVKSSRKFIRWHIFQASDPSLLIRRTFVAGDASTLIVNITAITIKGIIPTASAKSVYLSILSQLYVQY